MDVFQVLDRLEIHDNSVLNKKIESMTTHFLPIVSNDHVQLVPDGQIDKPLDGPPSLGYYSPNFLS